MIAGFLAFLVSTFLLGPLQSGLESRLAAAGAPAAVVQQVEACARDAVSALVDRATGDPWWAISTAFGAWVGSASPEAVLRNAAPGCAPAMAAARPFLAGS